MAFYNFLPEQYCGTTEGELVSFRNGLIYTHDNATRNYFYGTQYTSKIWIVANKEPDLRKKFNTIQVSSNTNWNASDSDGVIIDSDAIEYQDPFNYTSHKGNMQSSLPAQRFRYYEGDYLAEFEGQQDNL